VQELERVRCDRRLNLRVDGHKFFICEVSILLKRSHRLEISLINLFTVVEKECAAAIVCITNDKVLLDDLWR